MDATSASLLKRAALDALNTRPFRAPLWLRSGHAQTLYPHLLRRPLLPPLTREQWPTSDGDVLSIHHLEGRETYPRVVLIHGLEGGLTSSYIKGLVVALHGEGYPATVMEHRSCDGRMNRAKRLYHLGETTDLAHVVTELVRREPGRRLVLCGFSLGGNQVLKWLGESPASVPAQVLSAIAVSPPFDLMVSGPHMDRVLFGQYTKHFLRSLIPKALAKAEQFPGVLDVERIRRARTFKEFDTYATAALHGFADARDYWTRVSSGQFLPHIEVPTLLIASADDPFNPGRTLPRELAAKSPYLIAQLTKRGGHVGFVTGSPRRPRFWADEQIVAYLGVLRRRISAPDAAVDVADVANAGYARHHA
ncbi:MAG: YheT family hydrolase [Myxococcota bacterium]